MKKSQRPIDLVEFQRLEAQLFQELDVPVRPFRPKGYQRWQRTNQQFYIWFFWAMLFIHWIACFYYAQNWIQGLLFAISTTLIVGFVVFCCSILFDVFKESNIGKSWKNRMTSWEYYWFNREVDWERSFYASTIFDTPVLWHSLERWVLHHQTIGLREIDLLEKSALKLDHWRHLMEQYRHHSYCSKHTGEQIDAYLNSFYHRNRASYTDIQQARESLQLKARIQYNRNELDAHTTLKPQSSKPIRRL